MANKKQAVEIVVTHDRSGSKGKLRAEAIGGFNNFLENQKALPGAANLTVVQFDDQYEIPVNAVKLKDVKPFTTEDFVPRGMTAMNDALGKTLTTLFEKNPAKAIVCILTDGQENASKEYTYPQIKELIAKAEEKDYEIVFLASGIDAQQTSTALGMTRGVVLQATCDSDGELSKYLTMCVTATAYRSK